jgi:aspartyl-tRNA(Asn)/glutamyl-tRNA(Gln) amidotransferase subunit A
VISAHLPSSIDDARGLLLGGVMSATEVTLGSLQRIDETDSHINAFITVTRAEALDAARAADEAIARGESPGPLHGIPIGVKDNIDVEGVRTTVGSAFLDGIAERDATVVRRLKQAGAIIIGKTNLHEFAWGGTTENEHFGATHNPWDVSRNAHGSSGGSAAAVASGQCLAALGTDTGGSIRNPAAVTGLTGLRPTVGRVSNVGVFPVAWSMDTVGPIARTASEVALIHSVIAGHDPADPDTSRRPVRQPSAENGIQGRRVGIIRDFALTKIDDGVRDAIERALATLEDAGAVIVDVDMPDIADYYSSWLIVQTAEAASVHRRMLAAHRDEYGIDVRGLLHAGQLIPAADYILAQRFRSHLRRRFLALFETLDAFVTPTCATIAAPIGVDPRRAALARTTMHRDRAVYTGLASALAMPALSVPCGTSEGMPVGLQIMGAPFDEAGVLEIGIGYQAVTDWHRAFAPVSIGDVACTGELGTPA